MKKLLTSRLAWTVFIVVWIIGFGIEISPYFLITTPFPGYTSSARIQLALESQSEIKLAKSPAVLKSVARNLGLAEIYAHNFGMTNVDELATAGIQPWEMLANLTVLRPVKNSNPPQTDIICSSDNADEAALMASSVADAFRDLEQKKKIDVQFVTAATPSLHAQTFGFFNWAVALARAILFGSVYGAIAAGLVFVIKSQIAIPRIKPVEKFEILAGSRGH